MIYYDLKLEALRKSIGDIAACENEINRIVRTLRRHYNNNVVIQGPSGAGKTALLEGFAYRAALGRMQGFEQTVIAKLDSGELKKLFSRISQPETFSHLQTAFKSLPEDSIIIIDDFHDIAQGKNLFELSQIFEDFFEHSGIRLILAMSETGYQSLNKENPGFFRNFEIIHVRERDEKETESIITALRSAFEAKYHLKITGEALKTIVELSKKTDSDKKLPLRAIHFLDESLAQAKISNSRALTKKEVCEIFSEKTGVPSSTLASSEVDMLWQLEEILGRRIVGQKNAVKEISNIVRRSKMGLRNPQKPYGSFLFLGPSGVGKTELSKALAKTVYGSERSFTRIDMSEFSEAHTVQRLIGAPPGYVGFDAGGQLTNAIKKNPYSLILLDEIEKAHRNVFDIFLQILEDGRLSDGQGALINFTNSIIIATSNLGIEQILTGFLDGRDIESPEFIRKNLVPILLRRFRLEFLNRFDAMLVFRPLGVEELVKIAVLEIKKIEQRAAEHKIEFNINKQTLAKKIETILDYRFGARPVKRLVEETCENLIALKVMSASKSLKNLTRAT